MCFTEIERKITLFPRRLPKETLLLHLVNSESSFKAVTHFILFQVTVYLNYLNELANQKLDILCGNAGSNFCDFSSHPKKKFPQIKITANIFS